MSGNKARLNAVTTISNYGPVESRINFLEKHSGDVYGENIFGIRIMQNRLPREVYKSVKNTIDTGSRLDVTVADVVATAMKAWALEKGATHYAHVFFPLTGFTAEKHDSFLTPDRKGNAIAEFAGTTLIQSEPDASSFPSGGIRQTFEARGYTAWDVTSPAYIMENPNGKTLCIPTAFVSWTGEALDKKTPVLRSVQAVNLHGQRILKLFGDYSDKRLTVTCGAEQEYFLIDTNFFASRPDLVMTGRTLFGAPSPKGQEFDDHYFGSIRDRVLAFMFDVERELFKLGIPAKTRHNEVAPGQYELAPVYEAANIATDHQHLTMVILKKVAKKYGMTCILHEKPFAGVNGSGKHVNFSIGNESQGNLLDPGKTPHKNAMFLIFCSAIIRAVHKHSDLLRAIVATASNDHRLGANEAPPAILSIFLGDELTTIFEQFAQDGVPATSSPEGMLNVGVDVIPPLPMDSGDRNRTSPFAFTGNRFEFRAVGSSLSVADPLTVINTIIAESLDHIATELENAVNKNPDGLNKATQKLIKSIYEEHKDIIFNGDGYSDEWQEEATKRGLPNLKTTPEALPVFIDMDNIKLFAKYNVLSEVESHSRYEIASEQYVMTIAVEARTVIEMAETIIYPSAIRYQTELSKNCLNLKELGLDVDSSILKEVISLTKGLKDETTKLKELIVIKKKNHQLQAEFYCNEILPAMSSVRDYADKLEAVIADDLWTLPTYQEMMFVK
ncbi:MAG: glutamine synthetase type III [Desulfobacteraceae bacterium 4572_19]|nr:MAG: glutamine synthetase type III [Desulfobacteraceae bacterium 4572_19]